MRCPKCQYISFGSVERCRNCGYEFSLTPEVAPLDLPIQDNSAPVGPMSDLQLRSPSSAEGMIHPGGRDASAKEPAPNVQRIASASRLDLPLFSDRAPADDAPLISAPSVPRPPLSVRRSQPAIPKPRPEPVLPEITDDPVEDATAQFEAESDVSASRLREQLFRRPVVVHAATSSLAHAAAEPEVAAAPVFARLFAGIIDVVILLGIDASILYFTLRVLDLPLNDVSTLPPVPLAVFFLLLNGGYLAIFTAAGGQTIGKMLTGIRVVAVPPDDDQGFEHFTPRVSMGAAVLRATAYLASLLPAGLGFAAILFDAERRALHDRLAETRVIKA
jgi:uncharacterized RDD family membrane protein YckC